MAREPSISTPTAILLGSVVVALGLYFGLRGRSEPPVPLAPPTAAERPPEVAPPPRPAVDRSAVAKQVEAALAKHKKTLTESCLAPSLATRPEPKTVKLVFNYTFDTNGKQISRGVSEDRETSRADVTACVTDKLPEISVSPQGESVHVEAPLELP
jgi:hypothetical protein